MVVFEFAYFDPIQEYLNKNDLNLYINFLSEITNYISNSDKNPEYFFDYFVQKIIPQVVRHKTGEFYTPNFIVKKMVKEKKYGDLVMLEFHRENDSTIFVFLTKHLGSILLWLYRKTFS